MGMSYSLTVLGLLLFLALLSRVPSTVAIETHDIFLTPGQVSPVNSTELTAARSRFDRVVVMFAAPWCSACQRLKPKFAEAAASLAQDDNVRYLVVDATEEMALALQFDIQYYPTLVRIEKDGSCWEWQRDTQSLTHFGSSSFDTTSSDGKWNAWVAPYSRLGLWKHRLGWFVQTVIEVYQENTKGKSTIQTAILVVGIFFALASALLIIMFLSIWLFSPKPDLVEHVHQD